MVSGHLRKSYMDIYRLGITYIENISKKGHVAGRHQEVLQPEIHFVSKQFSTPVLRPYFLSLLIVFFIKCPINEMSCLLSIYEISHLLKDISIE